MYNYDRMSNTINMALQRYGGTVYLETDESVLHKGYGVFALLSKNDRPGSLSEENLYEFWLSPDLDYKPVIGDFLLDGEGVFIVVDSEVIRPNPTTQVLMWRLIVKA